MPRPLYPPEFKKELVELARSGRSPESLSKEFEPSAQTIRNWVKQADLDEGRRADGLTTAERQELGRLRRENKTLRAAKRKRMRRNKRNPRSRCVTSTWATGPKTWTRTDGG